MTQIVSLDLASWQPHAPEDQQTAIRTLEGGGVLLRGDPESLVALGQMIARFAERAGNW